MWKQWKGFAEMCHEASSMNPARSRSARSNYDLPNDRDGEIIYILNNHHLSLSSFFYYLNILYHNSWKSTIILEGAEMKLIPLEDKGFLVEERAKQVCLDSQRFNFNVAMYSTFLIRDIMLT